MLVDQSPCSAVDQRSEPLYALRQLPTARHDPYAQAAVQRGGVHALEAYVPQHCAGATALDAADGSRARELLLSHELCSACGEDEDTVSSAWDSVLDMGKQQAAESEEEARRRKLQKKSEKRASKKAAEAANAGNLSIYVSGIPKELSFNAVQNLFNKAGKVTRCKLYKDEAGENKGDGIVTFASEEGVKAALDAING